MTDHETICRLPSEYPIHGRKFYQKERNPRIHRISTETYQMAQTSRSIKSAHL